MYGARFLVQVVAGSDSLVVHLSANKPDLWATWLPIWLPAIIAVSVVLISGWQQRKLAAATIEAQHEIADKTIDTQLEIAERQIRASIRSTSRLKWVEQVRLLVTRIIEHSRRQSAMAAEIVLVCPNKDDKVPRRLSDKYFLNSEKLRSSVQLLRLLLNREKPDQDLLIGTATILRDQAIELLDGLADGTLSARRIEMAKTRQALEEAAIPVLRANWKRAAKGD